MWSGAGAASLYVPRYIAEVAPPALRGWLGSMNQVGLHMHGCWQQQKQQQQGQLRGSSRSSSGWLCSLKQLGCMPGSRGGGRGSSSTSRGSTTSNTLQASARWWLGNVTDLWQLLGRSVNTICGSKA
jgi:hypothetical protein